MLGGQNLCGGHQSRLHAVLDHRPAEGGGYGGFAAAHISLNQPVHGGVPGHIRHGFSDRPLLGAGKGEGQQLGVTFGELIGNGVEVGAFPAPFDPQQPQLQN